MISLSIQTFFLSAIRNPLMFIFGIIYRKIDYSEPTQDEIDRILYDDIHIRVIVNVNSIDNTINVDTNVIIDVDDNYC